MNDYLADKVLLKHDLEQMLKVGNCGRAQDGVEEIKE